MSNYRPRQSSPPPSRRFGDPRASTGMVFSSSFDPRYAQHPRHSADLLSSRSGSRPYEAQPISKKTYLDPGHGSSTSRTEYALRPRHNSVEPGARRPLSLLIPPNSQEANRQRPVISDTGHDRPRSPVPKIYHPKDDSGRHIYPAVTSPRTHHKRHSSATPDDYSHISVERDRRSRAGSYVKSSAGKLYPLHPPVARHQEPDGYSYTGPREQFDRDYPAPPRPRRNSHTRSERPMSVIDPPEWALSGQLRRETGPPPSSARQFDRIGRSDSHRGIPRSGASSDTERDSSATRRRHSRTRAPVSLHQDRDEGYSSQRDDYGEWREHRDHRPRKERYEEDRYASDRERPPYTSHHEQRHSRNRNESRDRSHFGAGLAAAGLGTLAATSLVGSTGKEPREKEPEPLREPRRDTKERRYHEGDREYEQAPRDREHRSDKVRERPAELEDDSNVRDSRRDRAQRDRSDSDSQEKHGSRKEKRHRRRHDKDHALRDAESESGSDYRTRTEPRRDPSDQDSESDAYHQQKHGKHRRHRQDSKVSSDNEATVDAPKNPEEERQKKVQLVEPPKEKEADVKPKGILKRPKQAFPEDPNPTREGVAPLKDAGKKGIPPGARWTKINRLLVNPAALEDAHERFEERDDYVIVLRVLSREEIQKFADKTKEIRETREREWRERKKSEQEQYDDDDDEYTSEDEDEEKPFAIEAPPPPQEQNYVPGVNLDNRANGEQAPVPPGANVV